MSSCPALKAPPPQAFEPFLVDGRLVFDPPPSYEVLLTRVKELGLMTLDVRFSDTTLIDAASKGDPITLEFAYTLSKNCFISLKAHALHLPKPKLGIDGPGGIQAKFDFQGALPDDQQHMLTVTLNNDQKGDIYL